MSRSGYSDDCDGWELIRWRGAVASAMGGKRGQSFLAELLATLDAMPVKELIANDLRAPEGSVCALGSVGVARGIDMSAIDPYERHQVATAFGIAEAMAAEIEYMNDDGGWRETPAQRWTRMREWVAKKIAPTKQEGQT